MNKREYAQANKEWLAAKAQEEGVKPLPKGIYYKVLAEGKADGKHPTPRSIVTTHHNESNRSEGAFLALNCSAFSRELLESELFGYKAGAFTGAVKDKKGLLEEANHGTVFLDEIGEMALELQAKLLRVLESGGGCESG